MPNRDLEAICHYHETAKHSCQSVRAGGHYLDWANRPRPFKIYSNLPPIPLPRQWPSSNTDALAAILFHAAGVTRRRSHPGGDIYFRAAVGVPAKRRLHTL